MVDLNLSPYNLVGSYHASCHIVVQALLKLMDLLDDELLDRPWYGLQCCSSACGLADPHLTQLLSCRREVLKTPFRHEAHSDVQGRIQEAFTTGCEFRETAACLSSSQELMTLQLLFLPVFNLGSLNPKQSQA